MKNKRGISMPFEWIFAMLVGGLILFLAIYGASKLIETGKYNINTDTAVRMRSLFNTFSTGLASGVKPSEIHFQKQSKIFFDECSFIENPPFGKQTIAFSEKTFKNEYDEKGAPISIKNNYVFAEDIVEGKDIYAFSKPFFMAYKVADLIMISSKKYCFYQAPNEIKDEIEMLNLGNVNFSEEECNGIKVCFGSEGRGCDIKIIGECEDNCDSAYDFGIVIKYDENGRKIAEMGYMNNLVYAAIFSSPDLYECNVKRLMNKFNELGKIYLDKIKIIEINGCSSSIPGRLSAAMEMSQNLESSKDLILLAQESKDVEIINQAAKSGCQLF